MGVDRQHIRREPQYVAGQRTTRPAQSLLQQAAGGSQHALDLAKMQRLADGSAPVRQLYQVAPVRPLQGDQAPNQPVCQTNQAGLPDHLPAGIAGLSGNAMDPVRVHRSSASPPTMQAYAYAYAQGSDIYPGPGQDQHLPHDIWHGVQQAQGRVKPARQSQGSALNDDARLEKEADGVGTRAAQFRMGTSRAALEAGKNSQAAGMIGLQAYRPQAVGYDSRIQTMTMPAADYAHWGPALQRRQIQHGAVRAGNRMVVTQFSKAPAQLLSWPSRRKLTCILLIGEGVLTVAAGIGSMALSSGILAVPGFMAALAGVLKIARGILLWPDTNAEGEEQAVDPSRLIAIDALRAIEAVLTITGGALAGNPTAIVFGGVKALRALLTAITDYMGKRSNYPRLRKGLMSISALLQFVEAGLVGAIGAGVIGSAAEASSVAAEGMTVAGGIMTTVVGGSKAVRGGLQSADTYAYHKETRPGQQGDQGDQANAGEFDAITVPDDLEAPPDRPAVNSDDAKPVVPAPTREGASPVINADTEPRRTEERARPSPKKVRTGKTGTVEIPRDASPSDSPGRVFGGMAAEIERNIDSRQRNGSLPPSRADDLRQEFRRQVDALIMHSINAIEQHPDLAESVMHAGIEDMVGIQSEYMK